MPCLVFGYLGTLCTPFSYADVKLSSSHMYMYTALMRCFQDECNREDECHD